MSTQYVSSVGYTAVAQWAATHTYGAGSIVRQLAAPAVGSERCFRTGGGGTSGGSEPTWVLTAGGTSPNDGSVLDWTECTGVQARQAANAWNAPHARLGNAVASGWGAAGDFIYISQDSNETQSTAISIVWPGTGLAPNKVICVNRGIGSSVPPVSADLRATALMTCSAAGNFNILAGGHCYFNGVTFVGSNSFTTLRCNSGLGSSDSRARYENCTFSLSAGSSATNQVHVVTAETVQWDNCTVAFAAVGQAIAAQTGDFVWNGGALTGAAPTAFASSGGNGGSRMRIRGVDLSGIVTGKSLVHATGEVACEINFSNCKLGAGFGIMDVALKNIGCIAINLDNCDSAGTTYNTARYRYQGSVTTSTTVVKTGGASDGTTQISHNYVTLVGTQASVYEPLDGPTLYYWRDDTNPHTVTVDIVNDSTTLNNDDIWMEIEYEGSAASPLTSLISTGKANVLATGAALPSSTALWTTPGISVPIVQKLVTPSFTPLQKGLFAVRIKMAAQNNSIWVDPMPQVT